MKIYFYHLFVYNLNKKMINIIKKYWKKIKKYIFTSKIKLFKDIEKKNVEITNIDFFKNKNVIYITEDIKPYVRLIDVENYWEYYKKDLVAKILYQKKKNNKIQITYNIKDNNYFNIIYKISIEFYFFLSQCLISKNNIFIQICLTGKDNENNKFTYFSNKIAMEKNNSINVDTIFDLMKENFINKYNFYINIQCIDLYIYFVYNEEYLEDEINLCMNKYYSYKKYLLSKNKE